MKIAFQNFMVFLFFLSACTVNDYSIDESNIPSQNQISPNDVCISDSLSYLDLGYIGIQEGCLHNLLCELFINEMTECLSNPSEIESRMESILQEHSSLISEWAPADQQFLESLLDSIDVVSIYNTVQAGDFQSTSTNELPLSNSMKILLDDFSALLDSIITQQSATAYGNYFVNHANSQMQAFYNQNIGNMSDKSDSIFIGVLIDIAKASNYFWTPTEYGGKGKCYEITSINNDNCTSVSLRLSIFGRLSKAILSDAAAAVISAGTAVVASGGAAAVPMPPIGIPPAGWYGIGGGATASVTSMINSSGG